MDTFVAKLAKFMSSNVADLATFELINLTKLAILKLMSAYGNSSFAQKSLFILQIAT